MDQATHNKIVSFIWGIADDVLHDLFKRGKYPDVILPMCVLRISEKLAAAEWGEGVVDRLAQHLARTIPGQRGFTRRNLFRMRQFFEAYRVDEKVTPLVTQLPWTHNLIILGQSKRAEEREFYLRMAVQQRWGKRELERRQIRLAAFENAVLTPPKLSPAVRDRHGDAATSVFKDAYALEFLELPAGHTEADLHRGLLGLERARGG